MTDTGIAALGEAVVQTALLDYRDLRSGVMAETVNANIPELLDFFDSRLFSCVCPNVDPRLLLQQIDAETPEPRTQGVGRLDQADADRLRRLMYEKKYGDALRLLRRLEGLRIDDVAIWTGISVSLLYAIERGKARVTPYAGEKIERLLTDWQEKRTIYLEGLPEKKDRLPVERGKQPKSVRKTDYTLLGDAAEVFDQISELLKALRNKENLRQKDVAKLAGVSAPVICRIEQGDRTVAIETAIKVYQLLSRWKKDREELLGQLENRGSRNVPRKLLTE